MTMAKIYGAHQNLTTTWRKMPLDIRQWCKWLAVSVILAMVMAAIGIPAWDDSTPTNSASEVVPNVEWYA